MTSFDVMCDFKENIARRDDRRYVVILDACRMFELP